jgi:hypothetical protein
MMLCLGGGPSLPHERVHIGINKAKNLLLIGRGCGVLPVFRKVPSDIIHLLLKKLKIADKPPKLHELRNELRRKGICQANVANLSAPGQSLRDHTLLALGGLVD